MPGLTHTLSVVQPNPQVLFQPGPAHLPSSSLTTATHTSVCLTQPPYLALPWSLPQACCAHPCQAEVQPICLTLSFNSRSS